MARQYLADGPFIDPPVASPLAADTTTTILAMWTGLTYTPIFANDPKAGKVYVVEAGGILSTGGSGTLILTPNHGANSIALGTSQTVTMPINMSAVPWYLRFVLVYRTIGAAGTNSTCIGEGTFTTAPFTSTPAAGVSCVIPFGGTSASVDATINNSITISKTLSIAGSWTTHWAFIRALN